MKRYLLAVVAWLVIGIGLTMVFLKLDSPRARR
jgi:xanthosine utilization system XapX-like protein